MKYLFKLRIIGVFKKLLNYQVGQEKMSEGILEHYRIERELAKRLRDASREERVGLYSLVYDELFKQIPDHPQLVRKKNSELRVKEVTKQMSLVRRFLKSTSTFLEIGSGDCALAFEVARHVKKVYAIDVSSEITKGEVSPGNFELIISDGFSIPVSEGSIDIAYSRDMVEHLHPDDFREQLGILFKKLTRNGMYICITPNRLSGPHDISRYFSTTATGFHIKEYTITELSETAKQAGFSQTKTYVGGEGFYLRFPVNLLKAIEKLLIILPYSSRRRISNTLPVRALLGITIIAKKST